MNFKPRQEHDSIGLDNADLTTMDEITYRAFPYNVSPGRLPDARTNRRMILTYSGDVGLRILDPHFLSHFGGSAGKPGDGACHA